MKSQSERLNDRLDAQLQTRRGTILADELHAHKNSQEDEEIDDLLEVARYLRSNPSMQVDSAFAQRLDRRVRAHAIQFQQRQTTPPWWRVLLLTPFRKQIAVAIISICLILGTGALALSAQAATPTSPLYPIKNWLQDTRKALAPSQLDEAEKAQQGVREHLTTLKMLARPTRATAYNSELVNLEHQLSLASQTIDAIEDRGDRHQANNELVELKQEVRSTLHSLLPMLNLPEQLATTDELNREGEHVIQLKGAAISISTSPHSQATITITGESFQPRAQLFINNQLISSTGTLQNGVYIFTVDWNGAKNPTTLSLLNPDGTLAQTTSITFSTSDTPQSNSDNSHPEKSENRTNNKEHNNKKSNSDSKGNQNGNNSNNGGGQGPDPRSSKQQHK